MGTINRAFRNISRRKIRALLVIIALGFSMAILVTIPAGVLANQKTANNVATGLSGTINQTGLTINQTLSQITCTLGSSFSGYGYGSVGGGPSGYGQGGSGYGRTGGGGGLEQFGGGAPSTMNQSLYSDMSGISGVAAVEPTLEVQEGSHNETFTSRFGYSGTMSVADYTIEGIPLTSNFVDNYGVLPTNITSGQNLQAGDSGVVVLGEGDAAYFDSTVGQTIQILGQNFQVVGIHGTSAFSMLGRSDANVLYMNLSDAQAITNNMGNITSLIVYAQNPDLVNSVISSINSLHPELSARSLSGGANLQTSQSSFTSVEASAQAAVNQTDATAVEEIAIVVVATSLIVLFVMLYTVRERTKEIGTLKAIGFSNSTVMSQFLIEGIVLSVIAGVVGIAIGVVAAPSISTYLLPMNLFGNLPTAGSGASRIASQFTVSATISPEIILIAFGAAVALGALGSLYPAWRASKIKPAEAMKYE